MAWEKLRKSRHDDPYIRAMQKEPTILKMIQTGKFRKEETKRIAIKWRLQYKKLAIMIVKASLL